MSTPNRVILLGNSILIAGIAANLADYPDLELVRLDTCCAESAAVLASQPAPVVFYDMSMELPACYASLLRQVPNVTLIGLHPNCEYAWVLSGGRAPALSMQDLADVIRANHFPAARL